MARSAGMLRVGRYFVALFALIIFLYIVVFWPGQRNTPKLGLDLRGGAQAVFQAQTDSGKAPPKSSLNEARQIMSQRVNGLGVSNAEVVTEGSDRIQVSVPGARADSKEFANISKAAVLNFRPEIIDPIAATSPSASASASLSPSASGSTGSSAGSTASSAPKASAAPDPTASATAAPATVAPATAAPAPTESAKGDGTPLAAAATPALKSPSAASPVAKSSAVTKPTATSPAASPTTAATLPATVSIKPVNGESTVDQWAKLGFAPPADAAAYAALTPAKQAAVQSELVAWQCDGKTQAKDDPAKPLVACSGDNSAKYLLGAVIVQGREVSSATAAAPGSLSGQGGDWWVLLNLKSTGQAQWADYTSKHNQKVAAGAAANVVAYVLDSTVDVPPSTISDTINGQTQITGYPGDQAQALTNQLKFGSLPLKFNTLTSTTVSATLGSDQLRAGLLAGGIGLVLVVVYSLLYYRALGLVTIASLLVSGGLTYAMLVILGSQIGFTLTLAGIAGFIVAVGITADSFVVFFERIKDEVHEGRSARVAVPRAWQRSRRTIISADTVSLLAAVVLYYFAAGDVRGFAFTLGMSTILDLVVVFLFTHPLVSLLSRSERFGSTRFSGLDSVRRPSRFGVSTSSGMPLELPDDENPDALLVGAPREGTTSSTFGGASSGGAPSGGASSGRATPPARGASSPRAAAARRKGATALGSAPSPNGSVLGSDDSAFGSNGPAPATGLTAAERAAARRGTRAKTLDDVDRSGEDGA